MTYNVHKVIPISDINPARNTPVISRVFMTLTVLIFILIQPKNQIELINFFYQYSAIPCELVNFSPLSESQFYNNNCFNEQFKVIFPNKNSSCMQMNKRGTHMNALWNCQCIHHDIVFLNCFAPVWIPTRTWQALTFLFSWTGHEVSTRK